eukprot:c21076_g1_i2 orf=417-686(-)
MIFTQKKQVNFGYALLHLFLDVGPFTHYKHYMWSKFSKDVLIGKNFNSFLSLHGSGGLGIFDLSCVTLFVTSQCPCNLLPTYFLVGALE